MKINRDKFFAIIKAAFFNGSLSQIQVDNINAIIDEFERRLWKDWRWLAYIFGTIYHETGIVKTLEDGKRKLVRTMAPVEEMGKGAGRRYGKHEKYDGAVYTTPLHIFYGRGHTQNTWYEIYEALTRAAKEQGKPWNFLQQPALLLQVEPSVWATFHAMSAGTYTGAKLSKYFNITVQNWLDARGIINGVDKADLISTYAIGFNEAIKTSLEKDI